MRSLSSNLEKTIDLMLDRIDIHIKVPKVDYEKLIRDRLGKTSMAFGAILLMVNESWRRKEQRFI